ncbi:hypothetical protein BSKO_10594 [Bryopsis sp. KO-2023]|nr:hypothetical protein BSKO_10594 [Bryopsis sp. KO-2023]
MALQGTLAARGGLPETFGAGAGNMSRVTSSRGIISGQGQQQQRNSLDGQRRRSIGGRYGPHALVTSAVLTEPVVVTSKTPAVTSSQSTPVVARRLPREFYQLCDPDLSITLPPHQRVDLRLLDNRELDKLVSQLGRNKNTWRRALLLHEWLVEAGHVPDDRLCTTLIRVCGQHGQTFSALGVYEWMKAAPESGGAGLCPSVYTYTAAMRAALAGNVLEKALQIWTDVEASNCMPDSRLCTAYIEVCTRLGQTEKALQMYQRMRSSSSSSKMAPTVHAYTAAMRAATEGGKWQKALDIWQDMRDAGVDPSGHAFAAAISACAAGGDWQRACNLFEQMLQHNIQPDVVSCTALISALATGGQWQQSEQVVSWMLWSGVRPNVRTYTALLNSLGQAQQWNRAVVLLKRMCESEFGGVEPNAYCFSALLKSLGEHGQWELAEQVFSELEGEALGARGLMPCPELNSQVATATALAQQLGYSDSQPTPTADNSIWANVVDIIGLSSQQITQALQGQVDQSVNGTGTMWNNASELHGINVSNPQNGAPAAGGDDFSLFSMPNGGQANGEGQNGNRRAGNTRTRHGKVNEVVCGALIMAYSKAGKWNEAVSVLARARRLGIKPNTVMYNSAISAAGKSSQLQVVEALFNEVHEPDAVTFETVIAAYGMAGDVEKAERVFQQMVDANMQPRDYAYCGLIAAYSMAGDWQSALYVRNRMQRAGITLTVHVYNALIAACERCGRSDHALQLHRYMEAEGVEANNVTISLLSSVGKQGVRAVEHQQIGASALSAAVAAAGALMIQTGAF